MKPREQSVKGGGASPHKELGQESAVLLDAAFPPAVRKIENDAVVEALPDDLVLIQACAVHLEKHRTA